MNKYHHPKLKNQRIGPLEIYLPLFPIVYEYSTTISIFILLIIGIFNLSRKKDLVINKYYLTFGVILLLFQIITAIKVDNILSDHFITQYRNIIMFSFIFFTLSNALNLDYFIKIYRVIASIIVILIGYQIIEIHVFNNTVNPIRLFNLEFESAAYLNSNRPMAVFTEPQKAGTYLIPLVIFDIFKRDFKKAIFVTIGILLTASSQGIIVVSLIWVYSMIKLEISNIRRIALIYFSTIFTLIVINTSIFNTSVEKVSSIGANYSDFLRLYKALITYIELPNFEKFFGVGLNNITNYILNTGMDFSWMREVTNIETYQYMSTGFGIFVETGIVVSILYYIFIIRLFEKRQHLLNGLVISLLLQMFSQTFMFNYSFMFYFLIIFNYKYTLNLKKGILRISFRD